MKIGEPNIWGTSIHTAPELAYQNKKGIPVAHLNLGNRPTLSEPLLTANRL
jgi:hypothetical protein